MNISFFLLLRSHSATLRNGMRQLQRQMQHTRDRERAKRIKFEAGIMRDDHIGKT